MGKRFSRRATLAAGAGLALLLSGSIADATDISGQYDVFGRNPNGSAYKGTVQIIDNYGVVTMKWRVGRTYSGTGRIEGRVLTVDWGADSPVIYVINDDGTLYGTWAKGRALELLRPR